MFSRKKVTFSAYMHKHRKCSVFSAQLSPPPTSFLSIYMTKPNNYFFLSPPSDSLQCNYTVRSNTTHTHTKWERGNWFTISVLLIVIFNTSVTAQRKIKGMWEQSLVFLESFWFNCAHAGTQIHTHTHTYTRISTPEGITAFQFHSSLADMLHQWPAWPKVPHSKCVCVFVCVCETVLVCACPKEGQVINYDVISCHCSKFQLQQANYTWSAVQT